jgi:hypothetical protein
MATSESLEIAALDHDLRGVHVAFTWLGDRYGHTIGGVGDGRTTPLLVADDVPLQEAVKQGEQESRSVLLLTGAGGGRYWSATVTPLTDIHFALLGFDFACRRGREAAMPGVGYRIAKGVMADARSRDGDVLLRTDDGREFNLRAAAMPTSIATESVPTCRVSVAQNRIVIEALGSPHVSTRTTVQWRYEISAVLRR